VQMTFANAAQDPKATNSNIPAHSGGMEKARGAEGSQLGASANSEQSINRNQPPADAPRRAHAV